MSVEFFYKHAGWAYNPATETPEQGRMRGARRLAAAERLAKHRDYSVQWEDDWSVDHMAEFDCYEEPPTTCEAAVLLDADGEILASLGCVDDATPEYRRVIEAELALEALEATR